MTETIIAFITAFGPSIVAIISIIASVIKIAKDNKSIVKPVIDEFNQLRQEVNDKTDLTDARQEMRALIQQNAEQSKKIDLLIAELSKVKQYDKQV